MMDSLLNSLKRGHFFATCPKAARVWFIAIYLVIVVIVLAVYDISQYQAYFDQNQKLAFLISFLAVFVSGVAFIPTTPITVLAALLLGPVQAALITGLGTTLSSFVQYQLGRQVGDVLNFAGRRARLPFKLGRLPVDSALFLLIVRFLPAGPVGLNFLCGATHVSQILFIWTALATNLIASALLAFGVGGFIKL
jgi:uncharacterized membrane protein YdjX (TVP38/TMEM64 family)